MLGNLIGAGASLLGGLFGKNSADDARAAQERIAAQNIALQREFAQNGIRWKVDDARAAGIHPLYALGAQGASFSPVSVAGISDNSMGAGLAAAGQDISRAINTTRTGPERDQAFSKTVNDLTLTKMGLENELLASQVAKLRQTMNPPAPSLEVGGGVVPEKTKYDARPKLIIGGTEIATDPNTANMKEFEDRYGDEGPATWAIPPFIMWEDMKANIGDASRFGGFGFRKGSVFDRLARKRDTQSRYPD